METQLVRIDFNLILPNVAANRRYFRDVVFQGMLILSGVWSPSFDMFCDEMFCTVYFVIIIRGRGVEYCTETSKEEYRVASSTISWSENALSLPTKVHCREQ